MELSEFENECHIEKEKANKHLLSTHMSNIHKRIPIVKKPSPMEPLVKKSSFVKELTILTIGKGGSRSVLHL